MPIRFFCEHCRQMLKIGTSKMGSVVDCPRCRKSVVVPLQSAPQAEQLYQMLKTKHSEAAASSQTAPPSLKEPAMPASEPPESEPSTPESAWNDFGDDVDSADWGQWLDQFVAADPNYQPESFAAQLPLPASTPDTEIALLALQKRYKLTATLLYVSTAVALFMGIMIGIIAHAFFFSPPRTPQNWANGGQNSINETTGTLFYLNENGERLADADAVIICLPKDHTPSPLFSCQGLRPGDTLNNDTVQLIHELGGIYERADTNGSFTLHYREGTRYFVVQVSAHQTRMDSVTNPSVIQELRRYFHDPELLGEYCLKADEYEWSGGKHSLERYTFESAK